MEPEDGSISRLIIFSVVVFPHPEGPTRHTVSPSRMSRDRSFTAAPDDCGNRFPTCCSEIMTLSGIRPSSAWRAAPGAVLFVSDCGIEPGLLRHGEGQFLLLTRNGGSGCAAHPPPLG